MNPWYLALVHHPINNKNGEIVTSSVTNLDIHDIARSCRTFGVKKYFIVTPLKVQHQLVEKILAHWREQDASDYNPDRFDALSGIELVNSVQEAQKRIEEIHQRKPKLVATGANFKEFNAESAMTFEQELLDNDPMLLLFGTGWGLNKSIVDNADYQLKPIYGSAQDGYNHLSVRSAVAIYLSQLLGK